MRYNSDDKFLPKKPTLTPVNNENLLNCDFNEDLCGYTLNKNSTWERSRLNGQIGDEYDIYG